MGNSKAHTIPPSQIEEILNKLHFENIDHIDQSHSSNDKHVTEAKAALLEYIERTINLVDPTGASQTTARIKEAFGIEK